MATVCPRVTGVLSTPSLTGVLRSTSSLAAITIAGDPLTDGGDTVWISQSAGYSPSIDGVLSTQSIAGQLLASTIEGVIETPQLEGTWC